MRHCYGEIHQAFAGPAPFRQGVTRRRKNEWPEGCGQREKSHCAQRHFGPAQVSGRGAARRRKTRRR
jgi:hypothetical protein